MEFFSEEMITTEHLKGQEIFIRFNNIFSYENWIPIFNPDVFLFFDVLKILLLESDISINDNNGILKDTVF